MLIGYMWTLLGELQEKLKIPKEEIYQKYVRECGVYEVIPIRNEAIPKFTELEKERTWLGMRDNIFKAKRLH